MMSLLIALVFLVLATGAGWLPVAWLDRTRRLAVGERLMAAFVLGCLFNYFYIFFVGPFRLDLYAVGGEALLLLIPALVGWRAMARDGALAAIAGVAADLCRTRLELVLGLAAGLLGLATFLQGLAPPNDYDSLMYHLSMPLFDVERGHVEFVWERALHHAFFPAFTSNLSRTALVLGDGGTAQLFHGLLGLMGGLGAAMLAHRMGGSRAVALFAALIFLSTRMVIWQMGSAETDTPLGALSMLVLLVYLAWRQEGGWRLAALFGLTIAAVALTKLTGLAVAVILGLVMLYDVFFKHRMTFAQAAVGPTVAMLCLLPHLIKVYLATGNPVYPAVNGLFNPEQPNRLAGLTELYGTGRGLIDLLIGPWTVSVMPMHYYDGMVLGAPVFLALAPLLLLAPTAERRRWGVPLFFIALFFPLWFFGMSQQVRFLGPILPVLAAIAAAGVHAAWRASEGWKPLRPALWAGVGVLGVNQAMFAGIYALLRLPVAVGLMTPAAYHAKTPTMNGADYAPCTYVREHLRPGEKVFSNTGRFYSYYCPQTAAVWMYFPDERKWWLTATEPPEMGLEEFVGRLEKGNFAYFITTKAVEYRRDTSSTDHGAQTNVSGKSSVETLDPSTLRFGSYLAPVFAALTPVVEDRFTAVYDGGQVMRRLREQVGETKN